MLISYILIITSIIFSILPVLHISGSSFLPDFYLIFTYFFLTYKKRYLPIWFIFLSSLSIDLIYGTKIGCNAIVYTIMYIFINRYNKILTKANICISSLYFTIFAFIQKGLFDMLYNATYKNINTIIDSRYLVNIAIYPVVYYVLSIFYRKNKSDIDN